MSAKTTISQIEWHRLVDGDPPSTGRYIVAHRGCSMQVNFNSRRRGMWDEDVSAFTHWAKEPCAPNDGTPNLRNARGKELRDAVDEAAAWEAFTPSQGAVS
jgi:hypothetical protein